MTIDEFYSHFIAYRHKYRKTVREGQAYMNTLHDCNLDLYYEVTGSLYDCYFDDALLPETEWYVLSNWKDS